MGTIRSAQAVQAYVPAAARPGCKSCVHRRPPDPGTTYQLRCGVGGFGTSAMAICGKYTAEAPLANKEHGHAPG